MSRRTSAVNPDCACEKDAAGVEPLFYCLENYEVTAAIFNKNTKAIQSKTSAGNTPLHIAMSMHSTVPFSVVKLLIKNFPMACMEVNSSGNLPIHVLFQYFKSPGGADRSSYEARRKTFLDTMGLLLVHNSKAHSAKNRDGKLPLHFATSKNVYVEAVKALTEKRGGNPSGVWCKELRNNSLPLHCAIAATTQLYKEIGGPSELDEEAAIAGTVPGTNTGMEAEVSEPPAKENYLQVIELLLSLYPDGVYEVDARQNSAFILAIKYNAPVRVLELLGAMQANMGTEMIQAAIPGTSAPAAPATTATTTAMADPGAASTNLQLASTGDGGDSGPALKFMFPVHYAVRFANVSAALVNHLVLLFPDSANYTDSNEHYQNLRILLGSFPLHMALENGCSHRVISVLLHASPVIASIQNSDIKLCIHFATWKCFPLEVVRALYEAFPEGARRKEEKYGNLPLHYAIQYHAHTDVIRFLLEQCPDGVKIGTKAGKLALHLACRYMSPLDVITDIMGRFPEAAGMTDRSGRIPYDYLLEYEAPVAVLRVLLGVSFEEVDWDEKVAMHPSSLPREELDAKSELIGRHMDEVEAASGSGEVGIPHSAAAKDADSGALVVAGETEEDPGDLPDINAHKKKSFSSLFHRNRKNPSTTMCSYDKLIKQLTNRNQQMVGPTPGKFNKIYSGVRGAITWLQCELVSLYRYIHQLRDELERTDEQIKGLTEAADADAATIRRLNKTIATMQRNLDFAESQGQIVVAPVEGGVADEGEFACPSFGTDSAPAVVGVYDSKKNKKDNFVQVLQTVIR